MQKIVLAEYTRDITKGENDKEIILYGKKKKRYIQNAGGGGGQDHLQILCTQQKKIKIIPKSNLFSSKVGGMNYPLEEHIVLSLLTTAKAWVIS